MRRQRQVQWSVWPTPRARRLTSLMVAPVLVPVRVLALALALALALPPSRALRLALPLWRRPPHPHNRRPTLPAPLWPRE